jgi:UDP:flavonoid glycosyltransferase YjiC (YdhE family)
VHTSLYGAYGQVTQMRKQLEIKEYTRLTQWKKSLVIAHVMFVLDYPRPLPPNILAVGPLINANDIEPHDQEVQSLMDVQQATGVSVVYIAFGSVVNADVLDLRAKLIKRIDIHLSASPKTAVMVHKFKLTDAGMKYLLETYPGQIISRKWINQKKLPMHNAVKAFVTHGGITSLHELIYGGKPT